MSWVSNFTRSAVDELADLRDDVTDMASELWDDAKTGDALSVLMLLIITGTTILVVGIIVAVVVVLLQNAGAPSNGTVHDKQFNAAHTIEQCTTVNKSVICTPIYYPDEYQFDLYDGSTHGWSDVPAADYIRYHVGDYYPGSNR